MNKKGFTLIEIIGAIIILGIIALIAFNAYTSSMKGFREDYYTDLTRTLRESGKEFFNDNRKYRPNGILEAQKITVNGLMTEKYIDPVVDYNGESCDINTSYVLVVKEGKDKYTYHTCLVCSEDEYDNMSDTYCDASWTDPTRIRYGLGGEELPAVYIYKGTTKDDLRDLLELEISYERLDYEERVIASAKGDGKDSLPTVFPVDMDVVDTSKEGTYKVTYEYSPIKLGGNGTVEKQTKERNVVVYENAAPGINISYENKVADTNLDVGSLAGNNKDTTSTNLKTETGVYTSGMWAQRIIVNISGSSIEIPEPGVTIAKYQWNKDGVWQDFCLTDNSCTVELVNDMNQEIKFRMVASNGRISKETEPIIIRRDYSPPTCTLLLSGRKGSGTGRDWYIENVGISFASKQEGNEGIDIPKSGIKVNNIYRGNTKVDRTNTNEENTHSADGTGILYVGYVEDNAGNFATCRQTFKRDTTAPTCELNITSGTQNAAGSYITDVEIGFNTSKNDDHGGSGVNSYNFSTGEQTYLYDGNSTGTITVTGYIDDILGNVGSCSISFTKDSRITVSFDSMGGSSCDPKTVYYGQKYGTLCNPTKSGMRFDGWYTKATNGSHITASSDVTENKNHTLYAHWVPNDTGFNVTNSICTSATSTCYSFKNIKFEQGLSECSEQSRQCIGRTYLGNIEIKCTSTPNGYQRRTNECQEVQCGGYEFVETISGASDCEVGSVFNCNGDHVGDYYISACTANEYTVKLNNNGASTEGTKSVKILFHAKKLGTITLPVRTYKVSFNKHSATATTTALTSTYTFEGWYDAASGGKKVAGNTTAANLVASVSGYTDKDKQWIKAANAELFAHWSGGAVTLPTVTLTGHTCAWYTAETGGTKVGNDGGGGSYSPTADITLHAICTPNQYTVTLKGNGATTAGSSSTTATYNSTTLATIINPQRSISVAFNLNSTGASAITTTLYAASTLNGWYTAASDGTKVASGETTPALQASVSGYTDANKKWTKTSTSELYAQWTNGSVTLPAITKSGATCKWNTNNSGTGTNYVGGASFTPTDNTTLYATCSAASITAVANSFCSRKGACNCDEEQATGTCIYETHNGKHIHGNGAYTCPSTDKGENLIGAAACAQASAFASARIEEKGCYRFEYVGKNFRESQSATVIVGVHFLRGREHYRTKTETFTKTNIVFYGKITVADSYTFGIRSRPNGGCSMGALGDTLNHVIITRVGDLNDSRCADDSVCYYDDSPCIR